jgi:FAD/FMN-containing dehydrogenase
MFPTLAGCGSMNILGKNHFAVGPFGEHVLELDLLTPRGEKLRCSRTENADVFRAAISGLGLLGAVTRVKLKLKKVHSGRMRVQAAAPRSLEEMFDVFEERLPKSDYLVGWLDGFAGGSSLGRGQVHQANYLEPGEDPEVRESFHLERQVLPPYILGVPKSILWRLMRPWGNNLGWRAVCAAKYAASVLSAGKSYLQSHVAFAFLLDYIPNWRLAYGPGGLIQVQVFVPREKARRTLHEVIALTQARGLPSYMSVFKRHRPDDFLLSHALDGYSLAMDFRVTARNREAVWAMAHEIHQLTLAAGGRLYFAKDAALSRAEAERAYGRERLATFAALKQRLDPDGVLESDLSRRVFGLGGEPERALPAPAEAASVRSPALIPAEGTS